MLTPEEHAEITGRMMLRAEAALLQRERDILAGVEGAVRRACALRLLIELFKKEPEPPPPPKPEMTPAEYFEKYGLPVQGPA
jgi:hypothetical protein